MITDMIADTDYNWEEHCRDKEIFGVRFPIPDDITQLSIDDIGQLRTCWNTYGLILFENESPFTKSLDTIQERVCNSYNESVFRKLEDHPNIKIKEVIHARSQNNEEEHTVFKNKNATLDITLSTSLDSIEVQVNQQTVMHVLKGQSPTMRIFTPGKWIFEIVNFSHIIENYVEIVKHDELIKDQAALNEIISTLDI